MPARNPCCLAMMISALDLIACNKAQRTPIRETSIEAIVEEAPPATPAEVASSDQEPAEAPECRALNRHITHCLAPGGGGVRIGPQGAVVGTSDGLLTLVVPPASLSAPVTLTIAPTSSPPWTDGFVSHVYDFSPEVTLAIPARLSLAYRPVDVPAGVSENRLSLYTVDEGSWRRVHESSVDTREHLVTAPLERLRTAGALGPLSSLTILPATPVLSAGDSYVFKAMTIPAGRSVSWAVSPRTVAAIDRRTGRLTALAPGRVQIVVSAGGVSKATSVTIVAPTAPASASSGR
jgi:hypothetical protein